MNLIQYWHEEDPPPSVREALASFREHNPELEQTLFSQPSAEQFISKHWGPREAAAFRACAVPAMQADYLRYCALYAAGGVYADATYRCVQNLASLTAKGKQGVFLGRPLSDPGPEVLVAAQNWPYHVGPFLEIFNSFIAFPTPGHPLLKLAVEVATANIEHRVADRVSGGVWISTGPGVLTSIYLLCELGSFDGFRRYAVNTAIHSSASLFCEVAREHGDLTNLWHGVEIVPRRRARGWLIKEALKLDGDHWIEATADTIYR